MTLPRLRAADGRTLEVTACVVVGRDETCDLPLPDEAQLSRRALAIVGQAGGAALTCLSRAHGLVVDADGAVSRLPPATDAGPYAGYVLTRDSATVTGPAWGASSFSVTVGWAPRRGGP